MSEKTRMMQNKIKKALMRNEYMMNEKITLYLEKQKKLEELKEQKDKEREFELYRQTMESKRRSEKRQSIFNKNIELVRQKIEKYNHKMELLKERQEKRHLEELQAMEKEIRKRELKERKLKQSRSNYEKLLEANKNKLLKKIEFNEELIKKQKKEEEEKRKKEEEENKKKEEVEKKENEEKDKDKENKNEENNEEKKEKEKDKDNKNEEKKEEKKEKIAGAVYIPPKRPKTPPKKELISLNPEIIIKYELKQKVEISDYIEEGKEKENSDIIFTKNNYISIDLDEYFEESFNILKQHNLIKEEKKNEKKEEKEEKEDEEDEEDNKLIDELFDEIELDEEKEEKDENKEEITEEKKEEVKEENKEEKKEENKEENKDENKEEKNIYKIKK